MESKKIAVIGSTNMDMVVKTTHLPVPGETVLGGSFFMNPGGKGANQAVAVARLGGDATFVTKIGTDVFGKQSSQLFDEEGINTSCILSDHTSPSGVALIMVDQAGENSIVVASGANANLMPGDVDACLQKIGDIDIILLQLEIPIETVDFVTKYAAERDIKVIVNPAPANALSPALLKRIDIITPNSKEAEMLSGIEVKNIEDAKQAALVLHEKGVKDVIVTLGSKGALVLTDNEFTLIPAHKVDTVDTTAAGDVFNGALAVAIAEGQEIIPAVEFACFAASLSVTKLGAQSSIPYRNELIVKKISIL
ncbi:ribokinase [Mucilaginibacter limnophilus]|uniref:Ribokinase n=1 Tax=Mucilaginibacter limnophilus TaxID=1932778 RepID=A0A437MZF0_9SPHI|nr:ribokinase [Mucilaginibacter limnophilus]RVU03043.1 ribokinase [Mucilaginibacter limnophilus]